MAERYIPSDEDRDLLLAALEILLGETLSGLLFTPPPSGEMPKELEMALWTIREMPSMVAGQTTEGKATEAWEWLEAQEGLIESSRRTVTRWKS
jgi:hypothetical protein